MPLVIRAVAWCDKCNRKISWSTDNTKPVPGFTASISKQSGWMRQAGWSVGKAVLCPNCKPERKTK